MADMLITIFVIVLVGLSILYKFKIEDSNSVLDIDRTYAYDFLFSIVIIFVHIPIQFQNTIQDYIGSFAYIGVSFFCMKAAYGVKYSYSHKHDYLRGFWITRLSKIIVPLMIVIFIDFIRCYVIRNFTDLCLIHYDSIYGWIRVLILFYVEFYLIYLLTDNIGNHLLIKYRDLFLSILIVVQSVIDFSWHFNLVQGWNIERIGFVVGIILFNYGEKIREFFQKEYNLILIVNFALTITIGALYIKFKQFGFVGGDLLRGVLEISFLLLVVCITQKFRFDNCITKIMGGISYGIYICHPLIFLGLVNVFRDASSGMFVALTIVLVLIIAYIVCSVAEWINNILNRNVLGK